MAERVTVAEAAQRLSVSTDTIQRRMKRGELVGVKDPTPQGFRWLVELTDDAPGGGIADAGAVADGLAAPPHSLDGVAAVEVRRLEELVRAYCRQLDEQRAIYERQVNDQAEELAARRREVGELHVLIQTLQRVLPVPPQDQGSAGATRGQASEQRPQQDPGPAPGRAPWWAFWRPRQRRGAA